MLKSVLLSFVFVSILVLLNCACTLSILTSPKEVSPVRRSRWTPRRSHASVDRGRTINISPPSLFSADPYTATNHIVDANNAFGFDLCRELVKYSGGKNIVLSPLSIFTTLMGIYAASSGDTFKEMANVLKLSSMKEEDVQAHFRDVIHDALYESSPQANVKMLNAILIDRGVNVSTKYTEKVRTYYNAYLEKVGFKTEPDYVLQWSNQLVKWWTEGLITKITSKQPDPLTKLMLLNAIYFKGKWATVFDPKHTADHEFHNADNTVSTVPMMRLESKFSVYCDNATYNICAVDVPYSGNTLSILIFLPMGKQGLSVIDKNMSPRALNYIISKLKPRSLELGLPKFSLSGSFNLHKPLEDLGMKKAFSARAADLSKLGRNSGLHIEEAKHKSVLEINEEGTVAAAATQAIIGNRISPPRLLVDKPFAFVIRNRRTNAVLFLGRITSL